MITEPFRIDHINYGGEVYMRKNDLISFLATISANTNDKTHKHVIQALIHIFTTSKPIPNTDSVDK